MRTLIRLSVLVFFLGFVTGAGAHIGDTIYLIFEITDADLADIELDANIEDWENVVGPPSLVPTDFFADPAVGAGAQYDPADMDYRIWLGWNQTGNHLYFAIERFDNIYINEYAGGNPGSTWQQDSIEFMVDGDHTGGSYNRNNEDLSDEEKKRHFNAQAQKFNFTFDVPDGRFGGYPGAADWANRLPYLDGFGQSTGTNPTQSILEFFVTPFDDLIHSSEEDSKVSVLSAGKIIGLQIALPDYDTAPMEYQAYHTLSGQAATFRYAERFVDARLVGIGPTAVEDNSWARVKAAIAQ